VSLPPEMIETSRQYDEALQAAVEKGDTSENDSPGYAQAAFLLLGRLAGLEDSAIWDAWTRGDRELVIARAIR
jgi:hypothetical protein